MRKLIISLTAGLIGARPRPDKRHSLAGFTEERAASYDASFW